MFVADAVFCHVRFGPSEWDDVPGFLYPQTKDVTGYCNVGDLSADEEGLWVWEECVDEVDFKALWYAVRGGGGGAYGVITSIYYQLHDYPGKVEVITFLASDYVNSVDSMDERIVKSLEFRTLATEFFFRFFFMPQTIGVSRFASNSCGCTACDGLGSTWGSGPFICYNGAEEVMIAAWKRFVGPEKKSLHKVAQSTYESWGHKQISSALKYPTIPIGKGADVPTPGPLTETQAVAQFMNVPNSIMQSEEKMEKFMGILMDYYQKYPFVLFFPQQFMTYILGGDIPSAGDGMNALGLHRRYGTLILRPADDETYNKFLDLFYDAEDGAPVTGNNFPGSMCHNHAGFFQDTLQRDDWTKVCDVEWDDADRHEKCFTYQEATLGVENVKKLEKIHSMVDPNRLFACPDCVGYADDIAKYKKKVRLHFAIV